MNQQGEAGGLDDLKPHQYQVIQTEGSDEPLPFDIQNKSIEQIKELGFKEVMNVNMEPNPRTGGMAPSMNYDSKEKMRTSFDDLQKMMDGEDVEDSGYLLDELRDSAAAHTQEIMRDEAHRGQPDSRTIRNE